MHLLNGSPDIPCGHVHIGLWLMTVHRAPMPHVPGQGSSHFVCKQALLYGHCGLMTHSGLQAMYGFPK